MRTQVGSLSQWAKDLVLLWLWHRLVAAALIQPLAWELSYAKGVIRKMAFPLSFLMLAKVDST